MENIKIDLTQSLMDEVYDKWNTPECKGMDRLEVIEKFFTNKHRVAVQLGNMNYQVCNGGWSQWHYNGYDEDLEDLIEIAKKGVAVGLENFKLLLSMLLKIEALGYPSDYNDTEHHDCWECGGSGEIEEYNEETEEEETVTCPECCGEGELREEINGEEAYCNELTEFDDSYYDFNEALIEEFDILLSKWDDIKDIDVTEAVKEIKGSIKPKCKLIGTDGNAFSIIGKVANTLKENDMMDKAEEFKSKAFKSKSYDNVLQLCMEYVDVY